MSDQLIKAEANPDVVRPFVTHLLKAFDEYVNAHEEIAYMDGMMAIHNAHVRIIEHLVEETGQELWRDAALATFANRMKNPGRYDTKVWEEEQS